MPYDHYKDATGVTWLVVWTNKKHKAIATVPEDAQPRYEPEAPDLYAEIDLNAGDSADVGKGTTYATDEQIRNLFIELVDKIEAYAKEHRRNTILTVTPGTGPNWWIVGALVLAAFAWDDIGNS